MDNIRAGKLVLGAPGLRVYMDERIKPVHKDPGIVRVHPVLITLSRFPL